MRYLGIDFGTKKVGLALSDEAGTMGFPAQVLPNDSRLADALADLVRKEGVGALVVGESRDFSGNENPVAANARIFVEALGSTCGVPVFFEPEMLTTQEARRDFDGLRTVYGDVDASAAALILSSFLAHHNPRPDPGPN